MSERYPDTLLGDGATCPFVYCRAVVETTKEMRHPGPSAGSVTRIKTHDIVGAFEWWGTCPASLMTLPPNDAAHVALDEMRRTIDRAASRREADEQERRDRAEGTRQPPERPIDPAAGPGGNRTPGRHSRWPRPDTNRPFR